MPAHGLGSPLPSLSVAITVLSLSLFSIIPTSARQVRFNLTDHVVSKITPFYPSFCCFVFNKLLSRFRLCLFVFQCVLFVKRIFALGDTFL